MSTEVTTPVMVDVEVVKAILTQSMQFYQPYFASLQQQNENLVLRMEDQQKLIYEMQLMLTKSDLTKQEARIKALEDDKHARDTVIKTLNAVPSALGWIIMVIAAGIVYFIGKQASGG